MAAVIGKHRLPMSMWGGLLTGAAITLVARLLVGSVLLWTGLAKLMTPVDVVRDNVRNYGLPEGLAHLVARGLPATETILGLALILGAFMPWPATAAAILLTLFAIAMAWNIVQGKRFACGCFGDSTSEVISWPKVARNAVLAAIACVATGILWRYQWGWPVAAAPAEARLDLWQVLSAIVDTVGILLIAGLIGALRSLRQHSDSSGEQLVEVS